MEAMIVGAAVTVPAAVVFTSLGIWVGRGRRREGDRAQGKAMAALRRALRERDASLLDEVERRLGERATPRSEAERFEESKTQIYSPGVVKRLRDRLSAG